MQAALPRKEAFVVDEFRASLQARLLVIAYLQWHNLLSGLGIQGMQARQGYDKNNDGDQIITASSRSQVSYDAVLTEVPKNKQITPSLSLFTQGAYMTFICTELIFMAFTFHSCRSVEKCCSVTYKRQKLELGLDVLFS